MSEITRASADSAGCWIDGHWGQYATARAVEIAAEHGFADESSPDVVDIARQHLASMGSSTAPDISDDEHEILSDAIDEVDEWMTDNVAPVGHRFEWVDGEWFLSPPEWVEILEDIRDRNAYQLAGDADCSSPDSPMSPGAQFLTSVRDDVVERWEWAAEHDELDGTEWSDASHEIADNGPDVYTHTMWGEFVDLAAWQEDPSEMGADAGDMDSAARICLYMIAERLASALLSELTDSAAL